MRVLLIEPHPSRRGSLERTLAAHGHQTRAAATGLEGLGLALADSFDAVVLDLDLTDLQGFVVLKMLRAVSDVAVIVTATGDEPMAEMMEAGANAFLVKPYTAEQLESTLQIVRHRPDVTRNGIMRIGLLCIDPAARVARLRGDELELTRKEFDVLAYLASRVGQVVSKRQLAAHVWRDFYGGSDRTVDVHLSWLRHKLGESAASPRYLRTVRGVGIKLVDPDTEGGSQELR